MNIVTFILGFIGGWIGCVVFAHWYVQTHMTIVREDKSNDECSGEHPGDVD